MRVERKEVNIDVNTVIYMQLTARWSDAVLQTLIVEHDEPTLFLQTLIVELDEPTLLITTLIVKHDEATLLITNLDCTRAFPEIGGMRPFL